MTPAAYLGQNPETGAAVRYLDPARVGPALGQLSRLQAQFPYVPIAAISSGPLADKAVATYNRIFGITLNPKFWQAGAPPMGSVPGFHPAGVDTPVGYITHEFGHAVDLALGYSTQGRLGETYRNWRQDMLAGGTLKDVSGYAKSSAAEGLADLFAAAYTPGAGPFDAPLQAKVDQLKSILAGGAYTSAPTPVLQLSKFDESEPRDETGKWTTDGALGDVPTTLREPALQQFNSLRSQFPGTVNDIATRAATDYPFTPGHEEDYAVFDPATKSIYLNQMRWGPRGLGMAVDSQGFAAVDGPAGSVTHEFGHAVDLALTRGVPDPAWSAWRSAAERIYYGPDADPRSLAHISGYAGEGLFKEAVAELFALAFAPGVAAGKWSEATAANVADLRAAIAASRFGAVRKFDPSEPRDEAGRWTADGGDATKPMLSAGEMRALRGWTQGTAYRRIQVVPDSYDARYFAAALPKLPAFDGTVYRGVETPGPRGLNASPQAAADIWRERIGQDLVITEPVSSTTDPAVAANFGHVVLAISQTDAARDISGLSNFPQEHEAVLAPGRYRIEGVDLSDQTARTSTGFEFSSPVATVRLRDVTEGPHAWLAGQTGLSSSMAYAAKGDRMRRFIARPGEPGYFRIEPPRVHKSAGSPPRSSSPAAVRKYDDAEPRDDAGRWTAGGSQPWTVGRLAEAGVHLKLEGITKANRAIVLKAAADLHERFPNVPFFVRSFRSFDPNTIAQTLPNPGVGGTIQLNLRWFGEPRPEDAPVSGDNGGKIQNFAQMEQADRAEGYSVDASLRGAVIHEFGHVLDSYNTAGDRGPSSWVYAQNAPWNVPNTKPISAYSGYNSAENFAESFTAWFEGQHTDSPQVQAMSKYLAGTATKVAGSPLTFSTRALQILREAAKQSYEAGFLAATASGEDSDNPADPASDDADEGDEDAALGEMQPGEADVDPDEQAEADAVAGQTRNWDLTALAAGLLGAGLTDRMLSARLDNYGAGMFALYNMGFDDSMIREAQAYGGVLRSTWNSLDDGATCPDCEALDGAVWFGTDSDRPYPGASPFGGPQRCGPRCRCSLDYDLADPSEVDLSQQGPSGDEYTAAAVPDLTKFSDLELRQMQALLARQAPLPYPPAGRRPPLPLQR